MLHKLGDIKVYTVEVNHSDRTPPLPVPSPDAKGGGDTQTAT